MENEELETKKGLAAFIDSHPKTVFIIRFILWVLFAVGLPFAFLVWRFDLFSNASKLNFGGWGLIAIILLFIFIIVLIRYVKRIALVKNVFIAQCISGFCKVILPLLALLTASWMLRNELTMFIQFLGCTIVCELIAIPVNPMPELVAKCQKDVEESKRKDTIDYFIDRFLTRKDKNK